MCHFVNSENYFSRWDLYKLPPTVTSITLDNLMKTLSPLQSNRKPDCQQLLDKYFASIAKMKHSPHPNRAHQSRQLHTTWSIRDNMRLRARLRENESPWERGRKKEKVHTIELKKRIGKIICSDIALRTGGKTVTPTWDNDFYHVVRHNCQQENVQFLLEQLRGTKGSKVATAILWIFLSSFSFSFSLLFLSFFRFIRLWIIFHFVTPSVL